MQAVNDLPIDEFNAMLDKEFSVFKQGEKYDYVKDLQDAYAESLRTPLARKILRTVPDHAFWDIKKPLQEKDSLHMNGYNPARAVAGSDFFDIRSNYKYFKAREELSNIAPSVSLFNFY